MTAAAPSPSRCRLRWAWWAAGVLAIAAGCATVAPTPQRPTSTAIAATLETRLGRVSAAMLRGLPGQSGFGLLLTGTDAFAARAGVTRAAQRSLDLQYYAIADDETAAALLHDTLEAADRGVRVRILLDDLYAVGRDSNLAAISAHPNVEVRVFNPFAHRDETGASRLFDALTDRRLHRRMHNKVWVADNALAIVGGRNVGDSYFGAQPEADFADLDVLAAGPVVQQVSASFDAYWNSGVAVPIDEVASVVPSPADARIAAAQLAARAQGWRRTAYARALPPFVLDEREGLGPLNLDVGSAIVLYDDPAKVLRSSAAEPGPIMAGMRPIVAAATHELLLVSPYFVPGQGGTAGLCALRKRGVRVRVLTNSLASTDVPAVHAGYARYRTRLLECGVELHEMRTRAQRARPLRPGLSSGASLHAKAAVIDRRVVLLGSMNFDPRSRLHNTELGLLIDSPPLGRHIGELFDDAALGEHTFQVHLETSGGALPGLRWEAREGDHVIRLDQEPHASWWRRLIADIVGALAPEELL